MFAPGKTNGAVGLVPAILCGVVAVGMLLSAQSGAGTAVPELPAGPAVSVTLDLVTRVEHPRPGEVTIVLAAANWDPPRAQAPQKTPKAVASIRLATAIETVETVEPPTPEPIDPDPAPLPRRKPEAQDPPPVKTANKPAPRIAVIIDDMGVDVRRSAQAAALPGPLTLSYLPYASSLVRQAKAAKAAGHELMVHVPMEPEGADAEPGPKALYTALSPREILSRLDWALDRFDGFVGVNNHMGSRFTIDASRMRRVLWRLQDRGLFFVDSMTTNDSVGVRVSREIGLPYARRDLFLDHEPDDVTIEGRLRQLEHIARKNGVAVAIGHPRDATIAALRKWLPKARAAGFVFVPVSKIVRKAVPPTEMLTARTGGAG